MKDFDLNLLRVLLALDQTRHVGRAAEMLGMSQSGMSTALMRLRRRVGDDLFVRSAGGMRPTPTAPALVEAARAALQQIEQDFLGRTVFEPARAEVGFRLSMSDVAEVVFVPGLLHHLAAAAPLATVQVVSPSVAPLADRLTSGEVDLAVGYFPDVEKDAFFRQPLYSHTYACIVRTGHPVVAGGLTRAAYQALRHAVVATPTRSNSLLESALEREGIRRRVVLSSPHHLSLPATIARTDLVATVPLGTAVDLASSGELVVLPLPIVPPAFTICQYWHRRTHREPGYRWLREQMKTLFNPATDPYAAVCEALYGAPATRAATP